MKEKWLAIIAVGFLVIMCVINIHIWSGFVELLRGKIAIALVMVLLHIWCGLGAIPLIIRFNS